MCILGNIVESRLENSHKTFSCWKQCNYANLLVHKHAIW